jgi:hypothetical protein
MEGRMSIQVVDLLEHTSCRVHLLRDLVSAVNPDSLLLSERGLCGLSMALGDIAGAIETALEQVLAILRANGTVSR